MKDIDKGTERQGKRQTDRDIGTTTKRQDRNKGTETERQEKRGRCRRTERDRDRHTAVGLRHREKKTEGKRNKG